MYTIHTTQTDRGNLIAKEKKEISPYIYAGLEQKPVLSVELIEEMVCNEFNISKERIHLRCRKRDIMIARQAVFYLCYLYLCEHKYQIGVATINPAYIKVYKSVIAPKLSFVQLASFYKMDHATITHSVKTMQDVIDTNSSIRRRMTYLNNTLIIQLGFGKNEFFNLSGFITQMKRKI